jgi:WD repeat-containing protein 35
VLNLSSVSIVVAEYIPAGANQIVQMNDNLGSMDRVQGGFFTQVVDSDSKSSQLEVAPGLTTVDVLDYSPTEHVNFEADIHYPEESDIIQVETFGVSMNASGCNFYGMQIEAVMDRKGQYIG